jgi:Undecaprenyl-phosphate glucose phosphotransferase
MGVSNRIVGERTPATLYEREDYRISPELLPYLVRASDILGIGVAAVAGIALAPGGAWSSRTALVALALFVAVYCTLAAARHVYAIAAIMRPSRCIDDILIASSMAAMFVAATLWGLGVGDRDLGLLGAAVGAGAIAAIAAGRYALRWGFEMLWRRGVLGSSMVVLGTGAQAERFLRRMRETSPYFCKVVGVFSAESAGPPGQDRVADHRILGGVEDLLAWARTRKIDDVVVALPWSDDRRIAELVEQLKELPINVHLGTDLVGFELSADPVLGRYDELPLFEVVQKPISGWNFALKAAEDYVLAGLGLIAISPLLILIAVAIKIDSPGPIFFMQKRLGFNNRPFSIYKFRSMHHSEIPESVVLQARRGDPRVTRVGRFIRATSLDELPQLLNVLDGTMSLVGPRPHALSHNEEYGRQIRGYFARHKVKPGITGWAQVNGLRGETAALELMEARVRYDVHYANNWSLLFDLRILMMTAVTVFFQRAAY